MRSRLFHTVAALGVFLAFAAVPAVAQQYQPTVGQEGKDVVWVPTPPELVTAMLDMARVGPSDFVMDLGSGDGRIVLAAAKRGARATASSTTRTWWSCRSRTRRRRGCPNGRPSSAPTSSRPTFGRRR